MITPLKCNVTSKNTYTTQVVENEFSANIRRISNVRTRYFMAKINFNAQRMQTSDLIDQVCAAAFSRWNVKYNTRGRGPYVCWQQMIIIIS